MKIKEILNEINNIIEFYDFIKEIEKTIDKVNDKFKLNMINIDNKTDEELKIYSVNNFQLPEIIFESNSILKLENSSKENNELKYKNIDNF